MSRFARWCVRHRWLVIIGWLVALVVLVGVARGAGDAYANNFELPESDSQEAMDLLEEKFPSQSGATAQVVFHTTEGLVADAAVREPMGEVFAEIAELPHVVGVESPYEQGRDRAISSDRRTAFATVQFDAPAPELDGEVTDAVTDTAQAAATDTLQVELSGGAVGPETSESERYGLIAAVIILLVMFGSVVAMGLPIITALCALAAGMSVIGLMTHVLDIANITSVMAAMISLGVGIDYALFIVSRFRAQLAQGRPVEDAVVTAIDTSGRAVLFAGLTVVIALLGLLLLGIRLLQGMAVGTSVGVLFTMIAALTLLPAVLGALGHRVNKLRVPGRHPERAPAVSPFWDRWAQMVQRRPWTTFLLSGGLLVLLLVPAFSLRLGSSDAGNDPEDSTTRQAYDLLADGFGPGFNGPLLVVAELPDAGGIADVKALAADVGDDPGVAGVTPVTPNPDGDIATFQAYPSSAPQDEATSDLVHHLRDDLIPDSTRGTGLDVHVGGSTATFIDLGELITERLPLFIGGVIALSLLLLMAVFRSILIPLKAAAMNVLAIAAGFGVLVAVFQWGWLGDLFGVTRVGPVESFLPVIVFAILFGLSMDYEVFLLSRVREEWVHTGDNSRSVRAGLGATGGVITAAALIMITVFGSFILGGERITQELGLGMASVVLLDAVVVRMALVPSVMELMGRFNWYLPRWLDRLLPRVNIEGSVPVPMAQDRRVQRRQERILVALALATLAQRVEELADAQARNGHQPAEDPLVTSVARLDAGRPDAPPDADAHEHARRVARLLLRPLAARALLSALGRDGADGLDPGVRDALLSAQSTLTDHSKEDR
jgi:RND superfamily putative drug exporter